MTQVTLTDFNAIGDGHTKNTAAFAAAMKALKQAGGGTLFIPAGVWLTGTVHLESGVELLLHPAATILGSPDLADYDAGDPGQHKDRTPWHLLVAHDKHDITIRGGTIDGNGPAFWEACRPGPDQDPGRQIPAGAFGDMDAIQVVPARESDDARAPLCWIKHRDHQRPSPMIEITTCRQVRIENVHITNSAGWLLHTHNTRFLWITGVKLTSNLMGPNNDGFDISGCQDVMVSDCNLSCCDDGIVLKTTPDAWPVERVTISNCIIRSRCAAIKFGCAETYHDFRQVTISNCVVYGSNRGIALYTKCGGVIEDVTISNITIDTKARFLASRPIHIECKEEHNGQGEVKGIGAIRNIHISGIIARTEGRIILTGDEKSPLQNIVLRDIQLTYPTIDDPAPLYADLPCGQFSKDHPDARTARAAIVVKNTERVVMDNIMIQWPDTDDAGTVASPTDWIFPLKAANGGYELYPRERFNTDTVPPFHVLWGRNMRGGYLRAPLAAASHQDTARIDLDSSSNVHLDH